LKTSIPFDRLELLPLNFTMSSLGTGAGTWRSLEIIDEFCQFFELSENIKKQLEGLLPPNQSTVSFILDLMQDFFETFKQPKFSGFEISRPGWH
jgi:hypothetical protein